MTFQRNSLKPKLTFLLTISCLILMVSCNKSPISQQNITTENNGQIENPEITSPTPGETDSLVFYTEKGIAIRGTDPVGYFKEGKPVKGNPQFSYQWGNATWYFSSAENRDLFASNPEQYAPQYGGFCAWAVSQQYTAPTDPNAWKIVDGKLYLNANKSIQKKWEKDIPGYIEKANQYWPSILADLL